MSTQPTVFVVDDDAAVRDSLEMLFDSTGMSVESFASASRFIDYYDPARPGCLVLDIRMPDMDGMELQQVLKEKQVSLPIIFITGHGEVSLSVKALKEGAYDFIEKPFEDEVLLESIHDAIVLDAKNRQLAEREADIRRRCERLTPREKEVMQHIADGKSNKEIAALLELSHRTVEVHRARLMEKMEVKSLAELVPMALMYRGS
uniref:Two component transcriptional regulator LuxR family n=1 Tax=uncultured organism TaxID=155900 RepID=E3T325_9ZZZZ|nr:two component transcriptional regulator LuxR family [uncultured organism]